MARKLKVTLVRSTIGRPERQVRTAKAIGLTKLRETVFLNDTPEARGQVEKLRHLVSIEEVES